MIHLSECLRRYLINLDPLLHMLILLLLCLCNWIHFKTIHIALRIHILRASYNAQLLLVSLASLFGIFLLSTYIDICGILHYLLMVIFYYQVFLLYYFILTINTFTTNACSTFWSLAKVILVLNHRWLFRHKLVCPIVTHGSIAKISLRL